MPPKYKIFYLILFFLGLFSTAISAATDSHESTSGISRHDIEAYHAYLSTLYAPSAESVGKERKRRKDKKSELADSTATVDTALQTTGPLRQEPVDTATAGSALSRGVLISDTTNRASTPSDSTFSLVADTTGIGLDTTSLAPDTAATDSARAPRKEAFEDVITYHANDSAVFTSNNMGFLFGGGVVTYQTMELTADEMHMDMDSSQIFATGRPDSVGDIVGKPIFKDPSGEYETSTMKYNFDTQKAFITNVITQQGEGFLTGGKTKKNPDDSYFLKDGKYTTCDNHEHPHFYLQLTKAKM